MGYYIFQECKDGTMTYGCIRYFTEDEKDKAFELYSKLKEDENLRYIHLIKGELLKKKLTIGDKSEIE